MRVAIAADHAGFPLKQVLSENLRNAGRELVDCGAFRLEPGDDYPDFAAALGRAVSEGRAERGILICGSGVGASVAVNKISGIRAGLCHDSYSAHQGVEHDDMNVLVLGSRVIGAALAAELVQSFLAARFSGEERHRRRLNKVLEIEAEFCRRQKAGADRLE